MRTALAGGILLLALLLIVIRPWRISEAWWAAGGAVLMILTGAITPSNAALAVINEWNLFLFFAGLMVIAAVADMARFFDWAAALATAAARGSGRRLLLSVFVLGAIVTTFLSNDAAVIILTPVVYGIVTRLRLRVMPFLFAVNLMANAASMTLPISNPINVLTGERLHASLGVYLQHLLPSSIAAIAITIAVLMTIFWRSVHHDFVFDWRAAVATASADRGFFFPVLAALGVLALAYIAGSALLWPLGVIAVCGAAVLLVIAAARRRLIREHLQANVSPAVLVYVAGLFVMVHGAQDAGITTALVSSATAEAQDASRSVIAGLLGSAVLSNVVNNLPGVLVFVSGAQSGGVTSGLQAPFLFGALAGADLGPNLTPVGSLSTMLWLVIVRRRGVEVSVFDFLRLGAVVAPLTLIAAGLLIAATFRQ
jgi:arsenical pump membrane protein